MALPQSPYSSSPSFTPAPTRSLFGAPSFSSGGGGAAMTYQQRARELLRRAGARGGGGAESGMMDRYFGVHSGAESETIGDVVASNMVPLGAGVGLGALDASQMGAAFTKFINGMAKPSTVAFVLGLGVRWAGLDQKSRALRTANNAMFRTMFPVVGYRLGERIAKGTIGQMFARTTKPAPAKPAATPPKTAGVETPIPGERTTT